MSTTGTPITVVSGPLGAGKTALVSRPLNDPGGKKIVVIASDIGKLNVDAELVVSESDDGIIDPSNGCICRRLRGGLMTEVTRLAKNRPFDYPLIEVSGISKPLPIAHTPASESNEGGLPDHPRLDTTVSVVGTYGFWKAFDPVGSLPSVAPDLGRPSTEVPAGQIGFCDILSLSRCNMVPDDTLDAVETEIRGLQPCVGIRRAAYSDIDPTRALDTGCSDFEATKRHQGWKWTLANDGAETDHGHDHGHIHDKDVSAVRTYGVESFVYCRDRSFHPQRPDAWPDDWRGNVVRAKGFVWVASRPETALGVNQARPPVQAGPIGRWGDDTPQTRLVFIGCDLDEDAVTRGFDEYLVVTGEQETAYPDGPFPRESA